MISTMRKLAFILGCLSLIACERSKRVRLEDVQLDGSTVLTDTSPSDDAGQNPCPVGMRYVLGAYCPSVEQKCLRWLDPDNKGPNGPAQCAEFSPSKCLSASKVEQKEYCIDEFEFPNQRGVKPTRWVSWRDMKRSCEAQGKRLCTRTEWTFACEGPSMKPYPYGDGLHRDATACNIDKRWRDPSKTPRDDLDQSVPSGSMPRCVSPFGVYDMTGNADEVVLNEVGWPYASGLMGGHWATGARNRCRPMTDNHNEDFAWYETGGRCCRNVR